MKNENFTYKINDYEKIIKALDYCCGNIKSNDEECSSKMCYQVDLPESREEGTRWCRQWLLRDALNLIHHQNMEIKKLKDYNENLQTANMALSNEIIEEAGKSSSLQKFKDYFDDLYGLGLEVVGWHYNGVLEPFDNFYDNAVGEMEEVAE